MDELPDVQEIYAPIGGGGLVAGMLVAIKEKHPNVLFNPNHILQ